MAQMKEQIKTPEKELSNKEIDNLSDAKFKTLVIRMPIEINDLKQKEEISSQPEQNEETRIQKNEERLRNLWDNFKHYNIQIIGVPKERRKSKKLKTYLNKS